MPIRRTDEERGRMPEPAAIEDSAVVTALSLSSERLGITAKLDRVELRDGLATPVETKRGRPRKGDGIPVWGAEEAQLNAHVLLLRDAGYRAEHAEVFFVETRSRHRVALREEAEQWMRGLVADVRANAARPVPPPPLVDSPKCPRCSLVGVCLPDETNLLTNRRTAPPRRLVARDDPRTPLYVMTPGAFVRKKGGRLEPTQDGETLASRRLLDVAHLAVFGNVTVSGGALRACLEQDAPVLFFTASGWFSGYAIPHGGSWVTRRLRRLGFPRPPRDP